MSQIKCMRNFLVRFYKIDNSPLLYITIIYLRYKIIFHIIDDFGLYLSKRKLIFSFLITRLD